MDKTALIKRIQEIDGLSNEERSALLGLLRSHKKYGLVWEDKPEDVEEQQLVPLSVPEASLEFPYPCQQQEQEQYGSYDTGLIHLCKVAVVLPSLLDRSLI